jgi:hypothetical protein
MCDWFSAKYISGFMIWNRACCPLKAEKIKGFGGET